MKPELKETIRHLYFGGKRQPIFERFLKPELTELSEGESTLTMKIGTEHLNSAQMIHGGVLASLADLAMGVACITYDKQVVTSDLHVVYIANVTAGGTIRALGSVLHNGKTLIRATCSILDDKNRLLVSAQATYFVIGPLAIGAENAPATGI
jgi:uncharacterized protein (TIGR00369 family)